MSGSIVRLETSRLLLRGWQASDLEPFAELNQDPEVMEFFPKTLARDESSELLNKTSQVLTEKKFGRWAVEVKQTGEFIGFIGLSNPNFEAQFMPCTEIAWRLARSAWGKGYATEGAKRVIDYAFNDLGLKEIVSYTSLLNLKSINVMKRLGMETDPSEDFDHPNVEDGHRLKRHVLYRIQRI